MRLAMSVVKKFVSPQRSFDDMLSDGIFSLMLAVDKFDYESRIPIQHLRLPIHRPQCLPKNAERAKGGGATCKQ